MKELPRIVADALTCDNPDGTLSPDDIELEIALRSPNTQPKYQLQITIDANDYPERRANLENRRIAIASAVSALFDGSGFMPTGYVWIRLFQGSFGEL